MLSCRRSAAGSHQAATTMIRVNNRYDVDFRPGMTVQDVLDALNFTFRMIVVKVDGVVVLRPDWEATEVPDGAQMQALHLISGG